jgi:CotS family spore coat protein
MSVSNKLLRVARGFGVKPLRVVPIKKGVYRVVLRKGKKYSLKRMPVTVKSLRWIDRSLRMVRRRGFSRLAWRNLRTISGRRLFVKMKSRSGSPFVLVPWLQGRWPSVHSRSHMRACGKALAQFHKAGRLSRLTKRGAVNKVGRWPSELRARHLLISKMVREAALKKHKLPMDRHLIKHGKEILKYSNNARRLLRVRGYSEICRTARHLSCLCHGDGGPSNFIINAHGTHLIDFETLRIDLRAYDLYRVIYNSCKDHSWRFSIARNILNGYQSVTKLTEKDFAMLRTLLRFPRTTYLLVGSYRRANKRRKRLIARKFPGTLAAERKMSAFLKKLDRYSRK